MVCSDDLNEVVCLDDLKVVCSAKENQRKENQKEVCSQDSENPEEKVVCFLDYKEIMLEQTLPETTLLRLTHQTRPETTLLRLTPTEVEAAG